MKTRLFILFIIINSIVFSQANTEVDLRWKLNKGDTVSYITIMQEIDTLEMTLDDDLLFTELSEISTGIEGKLDEFIELLRGSLQNFNLETIIYNEGENYHKVEMINTPEPDETDDSNDSEFEGIMKTMMTGVMLRGSVYENGEIHSFWVKTEQYNLLAMLCELPAKPVQPGDIWSLDVKLINNDQNFDCDSSYKINQVELTSVDVENNDTIATLEYNIAEYVSGVFSVPSFTGKSPKKKKTTLYVSLHAVARFSVSKGYWIYYDGVLSTKMTGISNTNGSQKLSLILKQ